MVRVPATRTLENSLRRVGFCHVAGADEAESGGVDGGHGCGTSPERKLRGWGKCGR